MATVDSKQIDMDERVWQQLLTLPYTIEMDEEGHLVMTALEGPGLTFEQLATTDPVLPEGLDWKVETNAQNQIIISPAARDDHNRYGPEIILLLRLLMKEGRSFYETGVKTKNGTRVPDVGWISHERSRANRPRPSFFIPPEICVEIISHSNTRREIDEKKSLCFGAGVQEVWRCELGGEMNFFDTGGPLTKSRLCPDFPARVELPE